MEMTTVPQTEVDRNVGCGNIYGRRAAENAQFCHLRWRQRPKTLSRSTQMHSVDLNKRDALWSHGRVLAADLQKTQPHGKPDLDLCVWGGKGRNLGPFVCSNGVSGARLQIRWTDFSKASLHSAWQPSTCCVLSLLKEESRTVSL